MFTNKVVWITGASSGIGAALAQAWHQRGAKIILSARREDALSQLAQSLNNARVLPLDLTINDNFAPIVSRAYHFFGNVDILVHNAGISQRSRAIVTPMANVRKIMETNFFGTVALTQAILPRMIEQGGGKLVVISSLMGKFGAVGRSAYSASKHALHGYFESLRAEEWKNGLRVTLVTPGYIKTDISRSAISENGNAHNEMDEGQKNGMSAESCAEQIIRGVAKDREEILIGGKEKYAVFLQRFAPRILAKILRGRDID